MAEPDDTVKTEKTGWGLWQQVMVVGVGTCALAYMLPKIMEAGNEDRKFIQERLLKAIEDDSKSDTALVKKIEQLIDSNNETNRILRPMTGELKKVASAVNEQVEQNEQAEAD
jgi:hypothetical protein